MPDVQYFSDSSKSIDAFMDELILRRSYLFEAEAKRNTVNNLNGSKARSAFKKGQAFENTLCV